MFTRSRNFRFFGLNFKVEGMQDYFVSKDAILKKKFMNYFLRRKTFGIKVKPFERIEFLYFNSQTLTFQYKIGTPKIFIQSCFIG